MIRVRWATWESGRGTVIADRPVAFARKNSRVPVIGIADVASVPSESKALGGMGMLEKLLVSAEGVGITHVVQNRNAEWSIVTSFMSYLEAEDLRSRGAICSRNGIVIGLARLQIRNLDIVVELAALSDNNLRAGRSAVISA